MPLMTPVLIASVASVSTASFAVSQNLIAVAAAVITTIAIVVAVISYIDKRIDHKLANRDQVDKVRYDLIITKIDHVHELVSGKKKSG